MKDSAATRASSDKDSFVFAIAIAHAIIVKLLEVGLKPRVLISPDYNAWAIDV
jgi:hypothetical protein